MPDPATARMRARSSAGFSLLEVLVAVAILGIAISAAMGAVAQGLRLLRLSAENDRALHLAERLLRDSVVESERVDVGSEGAFVWERRVVLMPVAVDRSAPPPSAGAPTIALFSVVVAVRWGERRSVELATVRAAQVPDPNAPPPSSNPPGFRPGTSPTTPRPGAPATG